jgi:peptidyl-prolyl cis-trans isomerase SurA
MTKSAGCGIVALALLLVQVGLARPVAAEVVDRIVAEVNDDIITMSELHNLAKSIQAQSGVKPTGQSDKQVQREMLNALIDRKLAKAEAKRRGITVSPKEVDEALARFKQRNNIPDDETLTKALANQGLSLKEFKQQMVDQITQDRLLQMAVGSKVMVSDAEVRRLYNERFKSGGNQVHLLTLRMPYPPGATDAQKEETKQKATVIVNEVRQGVPFADAASKLSLTLTDVGFVSQSDLDPRLAEFLDKLKPKDVAPVVTPEGLQLIQILGRRTGEARSYEEAAPEIRRILTQQDMEKQFFEWVKTLREKAHIKIML